MKNYDHLIEIDERKKIISIYRIREDGRKELFTSAEFPNRTFSEDEGAFRRFASDLGENLLYDSPAARRLLEL